MRFWSLVEKTALENLRDWKILVMTLSFAPFFAVLMYLYFHEAAATPHRVLVVNRDAGAPANGDGSFNAGRHLIAEMREAKHPGGAQVLRVLEAGEAAAVREQVESGSVDLAVEIPEGFTETLLAAQRGTEPPPAVVTTYGDPTNARYVLAAFWSDALVYQFAAAFAATPVPIELLAETTSGADALSEFDLYVPGLLVLAVIMLMFTAAASLIKEKDKGTIVRLRISNMTAFEWLSAVTLTQIVLGVLAVALTLVTTLALGYETSGSMMALLVISALSCLAVIAISVLVAAWLRTIFDLMTIGCFPFFVLMFFSGSMFPLPDLRVFELFGRPVNVNDILPTTHSISALGKVLNHGAGLRDVTFELAAIALLTALLYAVGTWLFIRRHMQASAAPRVAS